MHQLEDDEDKKAKSRVLQEIMGMMDHHVGEKLKGLKGNPKAIEVTSVTAEPLHNNGVDADMTKGDNEDLDDNGDTATGEDGVAPDEIAAHEEAEDAGNPVPSAHDIGMIKALHDRYVKARR